MVERGVLAFASGLRRDGRLDGPGEALVQTALVLARVLDRGPKLGEGPVAATARELRAVLGELAEGGDGGGDVDPFEEIVRGLGMPSSVRDEAD